MSRTSLLMILTGVLLNAGAQLLLKAGTRGLGVIDPRNGALVSSVLGVATQPYILAGMVCYILSLAVWIMALSRVEVSPGFPTDLEPYMNEQAQILLREKKTADH